MQPQRHAAQHFQGADCTTHSACTCRKTTGWVGCGWLVKCREANATRQHRRCNEAPLKTLLPPRTTQRKQQQPRHTHTHTLRQCACLVACATGYWYQQPTQGFSDEAPQHARLQVCRRGASCKERCALRHTCCHCPSAAAMQGATQSSTPAVTCSRPANA